MPREHLNAGYTTANSVPWSLQRG